MSIANVATGTQLRHTGVPALSPALSMPGDTETGAEPSAALRRDKELLRELSVLAQQQDPMAEEFEHRTVCHDVYHALAGGYWYRLAVFFYVLHHLNGHGRRVARHLLAADVAAGRVRRGFRERMRALRHDLRTFAFVAPRMLAVLMPWYTPRRLGELPQAERFLAEFAPSR